MRRMILRMIATGSLSAFSAAALNGSGAVGGGVLPVKGPKLQAAPAVSPVPAQAAPGLVAPTLAVPAPSRSLPRGSLLDISV